MIDNKKVVVVLPAYNAEKTLQKTYDEIPKDIVDEIILVDDCSGDDTAKIADNLNISVVRHSENLGYGANQKTCYKEALKRGADIVVMLHPDYQYPPKLVGPMVSLIASEMFDVVLGSRILGGYALKGGMPIYKYVANRLLTAFENILTGQKLSEYHTGFRAFSKEALLKIPLLENSDDFIFDNQMLVQAFYFGYAIGEISSPCSYNSESSSISFMRSIKYGLGVLKTTFQYILGKNKIRKYKIFSEEIGRKIVI